MLLFTMHSPPFFFYFLRPAYCTCFVTASHQPLGSQARWVAPGICPPLSLPAGPVLRDCGSLQGEKLLHLCFLVSN